MREMGRKGEIVRATLTVLAAVGIVSVAVLAPNALQAFKPFIERRAGRKFNARAFERAIKRLREKRMVSFVARDGRAVLEITESGRRRLREFEFDAMALEVPKKWNGTWTVIVFDIPEEKKVARDALHRKLRDVGCYRYNRSVFVHPAPCGDEIDFITEFFSVSPYVSHFEASSLGAHEYRARKFFRLV